MPGLAPRESLPAGAEPAPTPQLPDPSQNPDPAELGRQQAQGWLTPMCSPVLGPLAVTSPHVFLPRALPVAAVAVKPGLAPGIFRNINSHPSRLCFTLLLGAMCLLPKRAFSILGHMAQKHGNWGQGTAPGWGRLAAGALPCPATLGSALLC